MKAQKTHIYCSLGEKEHNFTRNYERNKKQEIRHKRSVIFMIKAS